MQRQSHQTPGPVPEQMQRMRPLLGSLPELPLLPLPQPHCMCSRQPQLLGHVGSNS